MAHLPSKSNGDVYHGLQYKLLRPIFAIVFNNIVVPRALAMTSVSAGVLFMLMRLDLTSMLEIYVLISTVAMIYVLKLAGTPRVAAGATTAIYVTLTNNFYQDNIIEPKICTLGKYLSYILRRSNPIEKETK